MNTTNPFQVPACFQVDHERRRRERFKRTFYAVMAAGILLMIGLLIEGCMSEHAKANIPNGATADLQQPPNPPASIPQPAPQPALSQSVLAVSKENTAPAGHPETIYVVKSGDTLTRIARKHGTTVKAIEAANGLTIGHIAVGAQLKMPDA